MVLCCVGLFGCVGLVVVVDYVLVVVWVELGYVVGWCVLIVGMLVVGNLFVEIVSDVVNVLGVGFEGCYGCWFLIFVVIVDKGVVLVVFGW